MQNQEPNSNTKSRRNLAIQIVVGVLVVAIFFGVVLYHRRNTQTSNEVAATPTDTTAPATDETINSNTNSTPSATASTYKDGTYSATGTYVSPGGHEEVAVTLTLANGVITDATVTPKPATPTSTQFQGEFVANYKPQVIGKNISDLKLSKVSGSSLTPKGFNAAVDQIKTQAQG